MQHDIASICTAIVLFANITQLPFSQASSSGCRYKLLYGTYKTCWIDLRLTFLLSALFRQRKVPFGWEVGISVCWESLQQVNFLVRGEDITGVKTCDVWSKFDGYSCTIKHERAIQVLVFPFIISEHL